MSCRAIVLVVVLGYAAEARADIEASIGHVGGSERLEGVWQNDAAAQLFLGSHVAPRLAFEGFLEGGTMMSWSDSEIQCGLARTLGGVGFELLKRSKRDFSPRLIAQVGVGREWIFVDRGTLARSVGYVGLDFRNGFRLSHDSSRPAWSFFWRMGVRAIVAPMPSSVDVGIGLFFLNVGGGHRR